MLRLVQLAVLGMVVLGATVLMALPRRDAQTRPTATADDDRTARGGGDSVPGPFVPEPPRTAEPIDTVPIVPPATPPTPGPRTHAVASGDTLQKIAKRYYGSVTHWRRIADANRGVDPSRRRPGTTLVIP